MARPTTAKRAINAVRLKRSPVDFCSRSFAATSSVASTSSQIVASGIVEREWLRRVAMSLRMPVSGMRRSPSAGAACIGGACCAAIAASTSRRTTNEPGPDPVSLVGSMP